jgi:glycosyltransferase involved in cell wall biosynthesis
MSESLPVSAIVPVHDGEAYLGAALDSVAAQRHPPVEVIVVDDGSTDGSGAVAAARPGVRYVRQACLGPGAARNAGLRLARGELIAFLDQDDLWTPDKLALQVARLLADPAPDACVGWRRLFLEPGLAPPAWLKPELLRAPHLAFCPGVLVVRRRAFERIGLFDPQYVTTSDVEWIARARRLGLGFAAVPEVVLLKRIHRGNQSGAPAYHRELARVLAAARRARAAAAPHAAGPGSTGP